MRILFMGTPDFARSILEKLHKDGENIVAVVTQPDKPQGRKMILTPPPVKQYAMDNGLPVYQPVTLKDGAFAEELSQIDPELIIVAAYGKILLDGKEINIDNLPDLPASALKKMEIRFNDGRQINLITTPVRIPANVKGNISRKVTILLTGTVPPDAYMRSSIYVNTDGILESFNWKDYDSYTQWTGKAENVRRHIKDLKYTDDYNVRVNVCKGVSQEHIDRLKSIFRECGVTRFNFARE